MPTGRLLPQSKQGKCTKQESFLARSVQTSLATQCLLFHMDRGNYSSAAYDDGKDGALICRMKLLPRRQR